LRGQVKEDTISAEADSVGYMPIDLLTQEKNKILCGSSAPWPIPTICGMKVIDTYFIWIGSGLMPPLVASFDVATSCGICLGRVGDKKPTTTTWNLREAGPSRSRRLLHFSNLCDDLFSKHQIDYLCYEAPLTLAVATKIGATEEVILLLRGAIGVLECCGARAGIMDIQSFNVQAARAYLLGQRTFPKDAKGKSTAKAAVMKRAQMLGVEVSTYDEADAVAGWFLTCGQLNPRISHLTTPLFAGNRSS
jgi:hypothetical protein